MWIIIRLVRRNRIVQNMANKIKIKAFLILASVLLASVSTSLSAEEKITGAFGVKFGQILDSQSIEGTYERFGDDKYTYIFYPDKKFRSFSNYFISITPKTRKIYGVGAIGDMDDDSTCEKEQALIMAIIKKKYRGEIEKHELFSQQTIVQDNRGIATICRGLSNVNLVITYMDTKLSELAENERIDLESSKVDSSGL